MVDEIITVFCVCDDTLNEIGCKDDKQARVKTSEITMVAIISANFFGGNYSKVIMFFTGHGYIKNMIKESRFNRRLNAIDIDLWKLIFSILAKGFKESNSRNEYAIDSFPIPVCSNVRIKRCKIYPAERQYCGVNASKGEDFYGIRVHMIVTGKGEPVEFIIEPGSYSDIGTTKKFSFNFDYGAKIYADKGYTDYKFEDYLEFYRNINLIPQRKKNSKRSGVEYNGRIRKKIETAFSEIVRNFPNRIHAVTASGFELKAFLFIMAYAISFLG
ncbi:MAG: Transposase family protein [candidate division TM6 bacterium GW2011_GWF2_30_66]|jgi:hypothetical protein|nr:MAG: Transposase family protein [candidate division TM6 bacterium GW2011_GWF2_30_66]